MLATTHTRITSSFSADVVCVEVHSSNGMPAFHLVGMAETAVKESRERVRSAIINSGFEFPWKRLVVNLSPADVPKSGSSYDLSIAIGLLLISGQLQWKRNETFEFYGELTLSGGIRKVQGLLPALLAQRAADQHCIVPQDNACEAGLTGNDNILLATSLHQVFEFLQNTVDLPASAKPPEVPSPTTVDWSDVREQQNAKQALLVAAAGGHSALMIGPPGCGKSLLSQAFVSLLPDLSRADMLQTAAVHSVAGLQIDSNNWHRPPFRCPHHTCSAIALIGGGSRATPGEVSLAHNGVLFLDEFLEFPRAAIEALREPLESGEIHITRAAAKARYPARFQLICAMNPCPCGYYGEAKCRCTPDQVLRYLSRLSGPMLDRIDMHIHVRALPPEQLLKPPSSAEKPSAWWQERIADCRARQIHRQGCLNACLTTREVERAVTISEDNHRWMREVIGRLHLSARAFHRILRLLLSLTDWQQKEINREIIAQAVAYRELDRE